LIIFGLGKPLEDYQKFYATYFTVKETPKRGRKITYNQEAIDAYKTGVAGFLVLLSNDIKDPIEALKTYRNKDVVEKAFDNLKNCLDSKRLRVHLQENMRGRLFIQFLALIFVSYIQKIMSENDLFRFGSLSNLLEELELMRMVKYEGHYGNPKFP
jgi:transposase